MSRTLLARLSALPALLVNTVKSKLSNTQDSVTRDTSVSQVHRSQPLLIKLMHQQLLALTLVRAMFH
jgi:hypothetical protein